MQLECIYYLTFDTVAVYNVHFLMLDILLFIFKIVYCILFSLFIVDHTHTNKPTCTSGGQVPVNIQTFKDNPNKILELGPAHLLPFL